MLLMYVTFYEVMLFEGFFMSEDKTWTELCSGIYLLYVMLYEVNVCGGLFVSEDKGRTKVS